ncbi:MAG TPA: IPT/TIG domain-containing protein [Terriglobales bacterium]|nr:IPT/TIG domain-containing protein [Terriglobales bacterium]
MKVTQFVSFKRHPLLLLLLVGISTPGLLGQSQTIGKWTTMSNTTPINPIHAALMKNGKILIVAGSGNCPPSQSGCPLGPPYGPSNNSGAEIYDPVAGTFTQLTVSWDMFCNDMISLPDGRMFINGGSIQYDPFYGSPQSAIFDPSTNTFTNVQNMAHGRWYPTLVTLGDGRIMTFSGTDENGNTNTTVEIYTVGSGWGQPDSAGWTPPLYPRMHLLPNGKVFYSGSDTSSNIFDPSSMSWNLNVANTIYGGQRTYGTSVLLPLTPANNYDPQVMIMGGNNPATATTEIIDLNASPLKWKSGPSMSQPRTQMNAVILPSGKVLALGGSANDEDTGSLSLNADLYDPATKTFSSAGQNVYERLYHSVALLLPDATVWLTGGNPSRGTFEPHIEIYQPAYLFNSGGGLATRPTISGAPSSISWGNAFTVTTPDAANISSVVLIRDGAVTHSFGIDQRMVGMLFTPGSGSLTVTAPPTANIAPPGYYMLFILNNNGVPSVAKFVQLTAGGGGNPAPTLSGVSPASGTTAGGTAVTVSGTGFLAGATLTFGGNAATNVTVNSGTSITATTPAHSAGAVNVVVTNTDSQNATLSQGFTYTAISNPPPTVTAISPNSASTSGGTAVTVTGTGFLSGATLTLGGTAATNVTVANSTTITAMTPAHSAGTVNVVVTNSDTQSGSLPQGFTYTSVSNPPPTVTAISPISGTTAGGTAVTITGTGFLAGDMVNLGGTLATNTAVISSTTMTATTPAHSAGAVSVVVTNAEEQNGTLPNGFTYIQPTPAPAIASIAPNSGTSSGGTAVTVTGTGFLTGAALTMGGTAASGVTVLNSTTITATTPAHAAGVVSVTVTNTDNQSGNLANGYTYTSTPPPGLGFGVPSGDPSAATVSAGQTASYILSIGGAGLSGTATFSCTGAPLGSKCTVPATQQFSATAASTLNVSVTTTSRTIGALQIPAFTPATWLWTFTIVGMTLLPGVRVSRRSARRFLWLAPLALTFFLVSCGGGASSGSGGGSQQPNPNGTPAGTYTLNVQATAGGATQNTSLTLNVQ